MKIHLLCKRRYTGKDLIRDCFGRLYHLPVNLNRLGAEVRVTAIDYRHSIAERHELDGVDFRALPATPSRLAGSLMELWRMLREEPPDIVIASGDSHIGVLGLMLARRFGAFFVFDVYDYYPAFASNRIPGMKVLFHKAVRAADLVLCASSPLMERLVPINETVLLVENGVDRQLFKPMDQREARVRLSIDRDAMLVGYFGSIQPARGPLVIEAIRRLRADGLNLDLLLAGPISQVRITEPWIRYFGELDQSRVPELIGACDLVAVPYANDAFNAMCGACKIAEYLSCYKPVVATDIAGHRKIFRAVPQSLCQPDSSDMAGAIRSQLEQPQIAAFPVNMEWEVIAKILSDVLVGKFRHAGAR